MKINLGSNERKGFKPVTMSITFESQNEIDILKELIGYSDSSVTEYLEGEGVDVTPEGLASINKLWGVLSNLPLDGEY